jgi:hypothetical protein
MKRITVILLLAVMGAALLQSANAASKPQKAKTVYGETRRDAALVYIYWAWSGKFRFFCDDQLVGVLRGKDYTFAYIAPGTHFFWGDLGGFGLCDFAVGQTYYLWFKYGMSILSEADGQATIKKASRYRELTQGQRTKAAGRIAHTWPKYKDKLGSKLTPAGGEIVYTPPASTENMVKIPAGTAVIAELMENLNSGLNSADDSVWVRTAEDIQIDGNLFVRAGTPVKALIRSANKHGRFRRGGYLDLTMVSVAAADGTVCPLFGQVATRGAEGLSEAKVVGAELAVGVVPVITVLALQKGAESFHPAGEVVKGFTRQDIWIKPLQAANEPNAAAVKPSDLVKAYARGKIVCDFPKGEVPQAVEIIFEGAGEIASAELVRVAGWEIPAPVRASKLSRAKEGWVAEFGGWGLTRFLRPGNVGIQLAFRLTSLDGAVVIAQAAVPVVAP